MVSAKTLPTIPTLLSLVGACVEWAHYLPQRENNDEQGPFFHLELGETFGVSPPCPTELGGRNVQWLEAGGAQPLGWWCIASGTRKISYQLLSLDLGRCLRVFPDAAEPRSIFQENSGRAHPLFQGMGHWLPRAQPPWGTQGSLLQVTLNTGWCAQFSCSGVASGILAAFSKAANDFLWPSFKFFILKNFKTTKRLQKLYSDSRFTTY